MWEIKQILAQIRTEAKLRMEMRGGEGKGEWGRKRDEKCELAKLIVVNISSKT